MLLTVVQSGCLPNSVTDFNPALFPNSKTFCCVNFSLDMKLSCCRERPINRYMKSGSRVPELFQGFQGSASSGFQGSEVPRLEGSSVLGLQGSRNPGLFFAVGITNARQTTTLQYKKHQIRLWMIYLLSGSIHKIPRDLRKFILGDSFLSGPKRQLSFHRLLRPGAT